MLDSLATLIVHGLNFVGAIRVSDGESSTTVVSPGLLVDSAFFIDPVIAVGTVGINMLFIGVAFSISHDIVGCSICMNDVLGN